MTKEHGALSRPLHPACPLIWLGVHVTQLGVGGGRSKGSGLLMCHVGPLTPKRYFQGTFL